MLMSFQQRDYEMALVANLTPEDAREAVSLIPSLDVSYHMCVFVQYTWGGVPLPGGYGSPLISATPL